MDSRLLTWDLEESGRKSGVDVVVVWCPGCKILCVEPRAHASERVRERVNARARAFTPEAPARRRRVGRCALTDEAARRCGARSAS